MKYFEDFLFDSIIYWSLDYLSMDNMYTYEIQEQIESFACTCNKEDMPDIDIISFPKVTLESTMRYKYILDIDGNTASWTRLPLIMAGGSVPLKIESQFA